MKTETYTCTEQRHNSNIGGTECYQGNTMFYLDRMGWVTVGDIVIIEVEELGSYRRVWVNGKLKTENNALDLYGRK